MTYAALPYRDAHHEVRRIVAGSGSSFLAGMRVLPAERRTSIFAVYAFCRTVDDIADGPDTPEAKAHALDWWADEIDRTYAGRPLTPVGTELARAIVAHDLPRREFALVLEGMRMDAAGMVAPTPDRLQAYIRRVAGAVGILSMRIFGCWEGAASERFALSLARAMQLTNILRDVEEDAGRGRLYLPAPVLRDACVPADPAEAAGHPNLPAARRALGQDARTSFAEAATEIGAHSRRRLVPALLMMGPYERLLARMEHDWSRPPAPHPGWRKALEGLRCAALGGRLR